MEKSNSLANSGAKTSGSSSSSSCSSTGGATSAGNSSSAPPPTAAASASDKATVETNKEQLLEQYRRLRAREESLDREIARFLEEGVTDTGSGLQPQMEALHVYNEMKDVTQMILGYLADVEQTTVARLHKRYGLPLD